MRRLLPKGIFPNGNVWLDNPFLACDSYRSVTMKTITTTQLGALTRARRRELGVTQMDVAMTTGTGLRFIIDLEKGKSTCQTGKMLEVLQALGLDLAVRGGSDGTPPGETS